MTYLRLLTLLATLYAFSEALCAPDTVQVRGYSLEYEAVGSGDCVVLLESGLADDLHSWSDVFEGIAEDCLTIRYSRIGQGKSAELKENLTAPQYAEFAHELLMALSVEKPVLLVGHSYGSHIARHFAERYPDLVAGILLVDPAIAEDVRLLEEINPSRAANEIDEIKVSDFRWAAEQPRKDGILSELTDTWSKNEVPGFSDIGNIRVTVIVSIRQHKDPVYLAQEPEFIASRAEFLGSWVREFPQGRFVVTSRSGHYVQRDEPQLIIDELRALLRER
jgi:pimeloyl-ACP methyl ester carboxylesterase